MDYEEVKNLNRPIVNKEIGSIIKNLPIDKSPGPDFGEFYQVFNEEVIPILILFKFFQKVEDEGTLLN